MNIDHLCSQKALPKKCFLPKCQDIAFGDASLGALKRLSSWMIYVNFTICYIHDNVLVKQKMFMYLPLGTFV